jgi:RNA polymerase sigma-70 factor (ECF subfamily)
MASAELEEKMAALMRAALNGDEASYAAFLRMGAEAARRVVRHRLAAYSAVSPEDVVQETLLAVHLKRHTWRIDDPILPWFMSITRYKIIDACRRQRVRINVPIDDLADVLAAPDAGSEGADSRQIERAVEALSDGQKKVVRSIAIEGRSIEETAAAFEMKETAVRVAFHRGLSAIAARFGRQT